MKFLFVAPGIHNNQISWLKTLKEKGHEIEYWTWSEGKNKAGIERKTIENSWISQKFLLFFKKFKIRKLRRIGNIFTFPKKSFYKNFKELNPDVVIARDPYVKLFSFLTLFYAKKQKKKTITYTQTPLYHKTNFFKKLLISFFIKILKAKWITPIKGDKSKYPKFHKKAFFVPLSIELTEQKEEKKKNGKINIISVGVLGKKSKKNILLLKALNTIKKEIDFHLTLIGSLSNKKQEEIQEFKKNKNFIKNNNLEDKITIKANVPYKEMFAEYQKNDLFILPSSRESFGYVILEAMTCELPVICSNGAGAQWYVEKGKNGYVFESNNLKDLIEKIRIITKKDLKEMGKYSRKLVEERYTPNVFYEMFMEVIKN